MTAIFIVLLSICLLLNLSNRLLILGEPLLPKSKSLRPLKDRGILPIYQPLLQFQQKLIRMAGSDSDGSFLAFGDGTGRF